MILSKQLSFPAPGEAEGEKRVKPAGGEQGPPAEPASAVLLRGEGRYFTLRQTSEVRPVTTPCAADNAGAQRG